jgi:hypothetical protein
VTGCCATICHNDGFETRRPKIKNNNNNNNNNKQKCTKYVNLNVGCDLKK